MSDSETLKTALVTHGAPSVNVMRFHKMAREAGWFDWTIERLEAAFKELESLGAVNSTKEGRYRIQFDVLFGLEFAPEPSEEPEDEHEDEHEEQDEQCDDQEPVEEPAPETPAEPAVKLVNKLPAKKPSSKLDALMLCIQQIQAPKIYVGDERTEKIAEAFKGYKDAIDSVNAAIRELANRTDLIDADTNQIVLREVLPDGKGSGGIEATYDNGCEMKILFREPWANKLTDRWIRETGRKLEQKALDMLGRMVKYVKKNSH